MYFKIIIKICCKYQDLIWLDNKKYGGGRTEQSDLASLIPCLAGRQVTDFSEKGDH